MWGTTHPSSYEFPRSHQKRGLYGKLAEWSKAADLKSVDGDEPSVGSNPTFPAITVYYFTLKNSTKQKKKQERKIKNGTSNQRSTASVWLRNVG